MADESVVDAPVDPETSRVLILGGTGEARDLAALLVRESVPVVSSLAGRVRNPRLPAGEVRVGGFGGVAGLTRWLGDERVAAVVDATHPFAAKITANAAAACRAADVSLLRLRRAPWEPGADDRWLRVPDMAAAAAAVAACGPDSRVLLTTGRQDVAAFADNHDAWFLIRVVDPPAGPLPPRARVLQARGPYAYHDEFELLREFGITALVTKNSGGPLTHAKLDAARDLGLAVIVVDRPDEPTGLPVVASADEALSWVRAHARSSG